MKITWPYVAGFFDGEGCVSISGNSRRRAETRFILTMVQSRKRGYLLLAEIKSWLSGFDISSQIQHDRGWKSSKPNHAPVFVLAIPDQRSVSLFINNILPHCFIKRTELQDCQRTMTMYPADKRLKSFLMKEQIAMAKLTDPDYMNRSKGQRRKLDTPKW